MPAFLVMNAGANAGARFELSVLEENLLGRDWECRIVLNDPQCSRVHAAVYQDEDGWWLRDNKSSNGTYVNGQSVDQARLMEGTEVRIGSSSFIFSEAIQQSAAKTLSEEPESERCSTGNLTIVLDRSMNPRETGQYTLDFLKGHNWGQDFFFLFQLSVKLLSVDDPESVAKVCMDRLMERTDASVVGILWLSDDGMLAPKSVIPEESADKLQLDTDLTRKVVKEKRAIRIEHDRSDSQKRADSICVPLIVEDEVKGAIHLYRNLDPFRDSHFQLACAMSNIMVRSLARANRHSTLAASHSRLVEKHAAFDEMLGESEAMQTLKTKIGRVSKASGCVLVRGESGSGKELVARAIHRSSPRADRPMLSVNCAAIPKDLIESQLFGHKKGAFTSADRDHIGWFEQADRGTLFLDEIGELSLEGQAKLLRTLEGHPFLPVGGTKEVKVDVRVICATNRDLKEFVAEKQFREDLFYRLSVYELMIPPLRDRDNDIQRLIDFFLEHFRGQHGHPKMKLSKKANSRLLAYHWPGNVRQLRNVIDSSIVMADGNEIQLSDLGIREPNSDELGTLNIADWEKRLIRDALKRTGGNIPQAAELLGISRATLYRKLDDHEEYKDN
ncbi:MAG: sigma 54-interacting transcriptional regulator [Mariniblastus sp.]|nr:sigma 54-interacting transcriptional regulator [Mariniblastus sp.]